MFSAGNTILPPVGIGVAFDPFACFPIAPAPVAPILSGLPMPPDLVSSPGFLPPRIFASDTAIPAGSVSPPASIGGIGAGGGPKRPKISADIQKQLQEVSTDTFGWTNFSNGEDGGPELNCVVWCDSTGLLINPTEASLHSLESAGINFSDLDRVILTESSDDVVFGIVKLILKRERIKIIASPGVFDSIADRARAILGDEYNIRRWVDHAALESGRETSVTSSDGSEVGIFSGGEGGCRISFHGEALESADVSRMEYLQSTRIIPRDLQSDRVALRQYLGSVSLFSHLDERDVGEIVQGAEYVEFAPGDTIIRKGDESDSCYVILTGVTDVADETGGAVWSFRSRDFFGDVGIQSSAPRSATVNARTRLTAIKIGRELYNRVIYFPLRGKSKFNSDKYAVEAFMRAIAPDIHLTEASIEAIALRCARQAYMDEVREGEIGNSAYIVLDGEVEVTRSDSKGPLATLGAMSIFGEMALCNPSSRRMASVKAKEGSAPHVLKIDRGLFEFIMYRYPGLDREIRRTIINRRRENRASVFSPHLARVPATLTARHITGREPDAVYNRWRSFLKSFDIDFSAEGVSAPELSRYARNVDVLHGLIRQILGEALLRRRMIKRVLFSKNGGTPSSHFDPRDGTLHISKSILEKDTFVFANGLLKALGEIAAEHLYRNELLAEEIGEIERSAGILADQRNELPEELRPVAHSAGQPNILASFLPLYVTMGDALRDAIHSIRTPVGTRRALKGIYDVFNRLFFSGIEFTRVESAPVLASLSERGDIQEASSVFDAGDAAREAEGILNSVFRKYSLYDKSGFYRKVYEPEIFTGLKLEFMRLLGARFSNFHIQRFTDQLIEVSVYDFASSTRAVIALARVREGAVFQWKVRDGGLDVTHGSPPAGLTLVNLESRQFGGVKGTPENILTIGAYVERHKGCEASVAMYDCQWPENSTAALMEEVKLNPPDVLGISATFGTLAELEGLLKEISHLKRRPLIVVGGLLSTWNYEYLLEKYPDIICVRFEGEEAMAKIVDMAARLPVADRREFIAHNVSELGAIPNIAFCHEGKIRAHSREYVDLSRVPVPDRATMAHRQRPAGWLMNAEGQGRGCDYSACYFCTRTHGKFRFFPLERGLEDFMAYMEADVPFIVYVDEDFLPEGRIEAAEEFARGIIDLKERHLREYFARHRVRPQLPSFYMAVRAQSIYKEGDAEGNARRLEVLRLLKKAGLVKIFLGAESGSPVQFHKTYHKGGSIGEVEKAISIIRAEGIQIVAGFITFDPAVTVSQLKENMDFMERNGLVFVDPLTEPLNPFKYFRAQAGSVLAKRLRDIGLLASSMDPDLLSYDSSYRNPLVGLVTSAGDVWKSATVELDYHLKGILWFAEQSKAEMEKARAFVNLFNKLKQADFELIKEMSGEIARVGVAEEAGVRRFLDALRGLPPEKMFFELKRAFFPHTDMAAQAADYIEAHAKDDGFDAWAFLTEFLEGSFPADFDFKTSSAEEYRVWLKGVRSDIAHCQLLPAELKALTARSDNILKASLEQRLRLLEEFAGSDWREFYKAHPEAVKRGKSFEATLASAIKGHEEVLAREGPLTALSKSVGRPYKINWRASLDDYLSYRHPDVSAAIDRALDVLRYLNTDGTQRPSSLGEIHIYEDGRIGARPKGLSPGLGAIANQVIGRLFINVLDPFDTSPDVMREFRAAFEKARTNGYANLQDAIQDLERLGRLSARPIEIRQMGAESPAEFALRAQKIWRAALTEDQGLTEQQKFAVINSLAQTLLGLEDIGTEWMEELANDIDENIAPATIYLPDTEEYRGWKTLEARAVFLHPRIYDVIWPGIRPHLAKLKLFAHPERLDSFERTMEMVRSGELPPELATLIYETYFNRLSPKAFLRNDDPNGIIRNYTTLSGRIMPRRTLVLLLDRDDPRVKFYEPEDADVKRALVAENGKVRFVVHPQVFDEWKKSGRLPYEGMDTEWALIFPTSSARTLYVLDEAGDYIAKTHSTMWVGPARRRLTDSNVKHSHRVSRQISVAIDAGELPPVFRDGFAFIDDSGGASINDPAFYPEKGSVGAIARSASAHPRAGDTRVLIPGFSLHNNAATVEGNSSPATLVQLVDLNTKGTGESPVSYFTDNILRPLYRMFLYFVFKQGILFEPHGQNFFVEVDRDGKITRLVFKDWQSTMVDMETRIRRGLPDGGIAKHLLGVEAGTPLSLSLVFDYYFGAYFFKHVIDTMARAYHGGSSATAFKAGLTAKFKEVFEDEARIFKDRRDEFPDFLVRHGKKPRADTTNDVPYAIDGPPPYRATSFERAIRTAVDERRVRGTIDVPLRGVDGSYTDTQRIDLERTRLYVKTDGEWRDAREVKPKAPQIQGQFQLILPKNFDPEKTYPLLVLLHGRKSNGEEVTTWTDKIGCDDAITVVPFAPFGSREGGFSWYDSSNPDSRNISMNRIEEAVGVLKGNLKVGKVVLGGNSQGGFLALHLAVHRPEMFDAVFTVNAPFSPDYLGDVSRSASTRKPMRIFHLESDQIVPAGHARRAEEFFRQRGFDAELRMHASGQHNKLSASMAGDIKHFLDGQFGGEPDIEIAPPQELKRLLENSSVTRMIEVIGRKRLAGYEIVLYEALLDKNLPLSVRCACLTALEQLNFKPIFDIWEDTTLLAGFREALMQIETVERMVFELTSHIAFIGKDALPEVLLKKFAVIVSSIENLAHRYQKYSEKNEAEEGEAPIKELTDTIECIYDMAVEVKREV